MLATETGAPGMITWLARGARGRPRGGGPLLVDGAVSARAARGCPYGTLAVNLSGALRARACSRAPRSTVTRTWWPARALVGAYTTFSTWMLETHQLAEDGRAAAALANLVGSLALGLGAAALGHALGAAL